MSSRSRRRSAVLSEESGFTLIEILVAIFLLLLISMGIYQATSSSFIVRETLSAHGEFYNRIRFAMSVLERDIGMMYSPVQMMPEKKSGPQDQPSGAGAPPPAPEVDPAMELGGDATVDSKFWTDVVDKTGIRMSNFIGLENSVSFIAASHLRIYAESPESTFAKITYEVRSDDRAPEGMEGTYVLVKTETPNAFDMEKDDDEYLRTYPLLRGIKSFKFSYYEKEKENWYGKWDTQSRDFKGKYPDAVKVEFEVIGGQKLTFDGTFQFRPEIPIGGIFPSM